MSKKDASLIRYCVEDTAEKFIIDNFSVDREEAKELSKEFCKLFFLEFAKKLGGTVNE